MRVPLCSATTARTPRIILRARSVVEVPIKIHPRLENTHIVRSDVRGSGPDGDAFVHVTRAYGEDLRVCFVRANSTQVTVTFAAPTSPENDDDDREKTYDDDGARPINGCGRTAAMTTRSENVRGPDRRSD